MALISAGERVASMFWFGLGGSLGWGWFLFGCGWGWLAGKQSLVECSFLTKALITCEHKAWVW